MQRAEQTVLWEQGMASAKVLRHTLGWLSQGTVRIWERWSAGREGRVPEMSSRGTGPAPTPLTGCDENIRFF